MSTKGKGAEKAEKFSLDNLRDNCYELFGVSTSTFDGATYGLVGEFTVDEMKTKINFWLKKPI